MDFIHSVMKNPAILGNIAVQPPRALAHIWTREDTRGTPPSMVTHQDPPLSPGHAVFKLTYLSSHDYKHLYFESDAATVSEIVLKVSPVWPLTQGWEGGVPPGLVSGPATPALAKARLSSFLPAPTAWFFLWVLYLSCTTYLPSHCQEPLEAQAPAEETIALNH